MSNTHGCNGNTDELEKRLFWTEALDRNVVNAHVDPTLEIMFLGHSFDPFDPKNNFVLQYIAQPQRA